MDRRDVPEDRAPASPGSRSPRRMSRAAPRPMTLRLAHFAQEDHPANIAAKQFASHDREAHRRRDQDQHLPQQRARRAARAGAADQARHHRHGPADAGPARQVRQRLRRRAAAVRLRQAPAHVYRDARRAGDGLAGAAGREAGLHPAAQLGIRLPQRHQQRAPDQRARRREGPEDPHAARTADPGLDGGARRDGAGDRVSRSSTSRCRRRWSTARRTRSR